MKLRLEHNTLRLRLDPPEVAEFARQGQLATTVPLGPTAAQHLTYTLERTPGASYTTVRYEPQRVRVLLPAPVADAWTATDEVSVRGTLEVSDNQVLHILVEKDLGCKH